MALTNGIGLRWQPGQTQGTRIPMQQAGQSGGPSPAVTGGPSATKVLSLNIPSRTAPNQPVATELLKAPGGMGLPNLPSLLSLLQQALSPRPAGGSPLSPDPTSYSGWMQNERQLPGAPSATIGGGGRAPVPRIDLQDPEKTPAPTSQGPLDLSDLLLGKQWQVPETRYDPGPSVSAPTDVQGLDGFF